MFSIGGTTTPSFNPACALNVCCFICSKLRKIDHQGKQTIELPPLYMFDSTLVLILHEYFRMDFANEEVDPLLGKIDHPVGNNEDIALGSNLHSFKCPTCGGESSDYNSHQIHAEICKQFKSGKFNPH